MNSLGKKLAVEKLCVLHASEVDPDFTVRFHDYIAFGDWTDSSEGPAIWFHGGTPFSGSLKNAPIMHFNIYGECFVTPSMWMNEHNCPHIFCEEYLNELTAFVQCNLPVFYLVYQGCLDKSDAIDYFRGSLRWEDMLSLIYGVADHLYAGLLLCNNPAQLHTFCVEEEVYGGEKYDPDIPLLCKRLEKLQQPVFDLTFDCDGYTIHKYNGDKQTVYIPEDTITIGENAFADHKEIKKIIFPDTVEIIERGAFRGCSGVEKLVLPPSLWEVFPNAFAECTQLRTVCFTAATHEFFIEDNAFYGCSALSEVYIPAGGVLDDMPFAACPQVVLRCAKGSNAEQYARENQIPYISNQ